MNKTLIFLLLTSFLLVVSCGTRDSSISPEHMEKLLRQLYSGSQGLEINFLKNAPPQQIPENSELQLIFNLENKGAFDMNNSYFTVGYEPDYVTLKDAKLDDKKLELDKIVAFTLAGRSLYVPRGGIKTAVYTFHAPPIENLSLYHDTVFRVTACYDYSTYLVADICVNLDQANQNKPTKGVCEFQPLTYTGQGGPVGISLIDVRILPWDTTHKPEFYIEITNHGQGTILNKNDIYKACTNQPINRSTLNYVYFNGTFMGKELDCRPNPVLIKDNLGKIYCTTEKFQESELASRRSFLSPLLIRFDYGYTQTWSTSTRITKLPE